MLTSLEVETLLQTMKYSVCFARRESDNRWTISLNNGRGLTMPTIERRFKNVPLEIVKFGWHEYSGHYMTVRECLQE